MMNDVKNQMHDKKVCIIVPVYNAEKYLGHCLDSLLNQTYENWTAVLVDDGSKDSSLEICRRYEKLDSRFLVISQPNSGVSKARNMGLMHAEGDYLEFLDSDDYLAPNALERQVSLAREYNSQLVVMDIMMVDFSAPEKGKTMLSSVWLEESPCWLSKEEFKAKRMQLIWHTVLLECLHCKLYDLKLWKKLDIKFPEDVSLGEDFIANMCYFEACNNAVFVQECGHYYNCIQGSDSLTNKYRPDLYENKLLLVEKLEAHLGGRERLSERERDAFYCYGANSMLAAVERYVLDSNAPKEEQNKRLGEIFGNQLFAECVAHASYIEERFENLVTAFLKPDAQQAGAALYEGGRECKDEQNERGKVCVVVPVYNAEKYLGYCLNSLVSQTYTNWTAILVDDGSTDASLEICRNYAKMDSRFRVVAQENGGVSKARNKGLEFARGEYLEFLDSDDCLTQDALEKQVSLAVQYRSQLVVTNTTILDFNNPEGDKITLSSKWLKKSPCYLNAEEFKEKQMRLIWYTSLMEGPCAKLYDLKLWKKLELEFPEDLSLGEDFVVNMKYYANCNGAVYLDETCYYYNQYMGSGSLTEKYRENLFEIKMDLAQRMESHLGGRKNLSAPELEVFYCYVATYGLVCIEKTVLLSGLPQEQLKERLQKMLDHPLLKESLQYATDIPERFAGCIKAIRKNDVDYVAAYICGNVYKKEKEENAVTPVVQKSKPRLMNRIIRKLMRLTIPHLGTGAMAERVTRWEREFATNGLKAAFRKHFYIHKKANRAMLEDLEQRLMEQNQRLMEQNQRLEEKNLELSARLNEITASQTFLIEWLEDRFSESREFQNSMIQQIDKVKEMQMRHARQIQQNVYGYIESSEERLRKEAHLRQDQ